MFRQDKCGGIYDEVLKNMLYDCSDSSLFDMITDL